MNKRNLTKIAKWLENGALHSNITFDMNVPISVNVATKKELASPACHTTCCIAGAAVQFFGDVAPVVRYHERVSMTSWEQVSRTASELLGLDDSTAEQLFNPNRFDHTRSLYSFSDPAWAARVIRDLIATGEVNWKRNYHASK